jgi:hypothetical protein
LPGQTTKALEQVGKAVKKASGDIFKVEDLKASAKGANMALTSPEQVQKMGQQAVAAISKAGEGFLAKLKEAWLWVLDKVLTPIWNLVTKAWRWVWTQVIQPIIGIVETAWQMVIDFIRNIPEFVRLAWEFVISFFQTFGALISDAWSGIMNFFQSLGSVLSEAWSGVISSLKGITDAFGQVFEQGASLLSGVWNSAKEIFGGIGDALKSTFAGIGQFFNGITEGFKKLLDFDFSGFKTAIGDAFSTAGESIKGIFRKILQPIIDLMNGLKLQRVDVGFELFKKSYSFTLIPEMDLIPGELALPFARGGLVPAYAADGGFFEPRGTDTVPAMLTPGEFVVNRSATAGNLDALQRINAGKGSGGDVQIGSIVINAKSDLSTDSIRREVIPELFKQIKKRSQEGEFIIASAGVR